MKRQLLDNLKNIPGWHTSEKLVVFSVDDYSNVRLDSRAARDRMVASGVELQGRFDHLDTLEARQDLEGLLETLSSVTDSRGRHAVFTPYALSANPDFEAMAQSDQGYRYEPLTRTFRRLAPERGHGPILRRQQLAQNRFSMFLGIPLRNLLSGPSVFEDAKHRSGYYYSDTGDLPPMETDP